MDDWATALINLTMALVTVWIVNRYLNIYFQKKKTNLLNVALWIIFGIFQILTEYFMGNSSIWIFLTHIVLVTLIASTGFIRARNKKFFYIVLLFLYWMFIEIFCYYFLKILPIGNNFTILGSVISKLITIAFIEILNIKFNINKKDTVPITYYLMLLFIPLGCAYIAHNIFTLGSSYKLVTTIAFSILLIINLIIFEIYGKLAESFVILKENIIYEQQMELLTRNTEEQKRTMKEFYEEKHNLINQLVVLRENVENNHLQDAVNSLNYIIQIYSTNTERISNSGNNVVDAMINFKYTLAKKQGIDFKLKIFIPQEIPIQPNDLGIILGNSLDNAIEATSKCEKQIKTINLSLGLRKGALIIVISNPYCHELTKDKDGNYITTKKDALKHGYGMNLTKKIADKYQGNVNIDEEKGIFSLTIILNI